MANIQNNPKFPHVDMTPMVDLGFLLITFFMLTTTLQKPKVMELGMPEPDLDVRTFVKESDGFTVILDKDRSIKYFEGQKGEMKSTDFQHIRKILFEAKQNKGKHFFVVIKATTDAQYGSMVDILDELMISNCQRYAIATLSLEDKARL